MAAGTTTVTRPKWHAILLIPLALSAFTHLWNPVGFPAIFYDEGIYMRRAMHVMEGLGPQEWAFYDHPYFGQIFLASTLSLVGYPGSLQPGTDAESIASLYAVPRILMGLLAVLDTFLIFKITEHRYGRRVALIAAILFAVMPLTWLLRRILLDSILLPFLLSSVLFATYASSASGSKKTALVLIAGIFLGTAIFTKVPAFTMIPLVGYIIYSGSAGNRLKTVGLWLIPVIGIPLIWPAYSVSINEFDFWLGDVLWQTQRQSVGVWAILEDHFSFDPVLLILGIAGIGYAAIKKQLFILLWIIPFVTFSTFIGYLQHFHWIPILPVFCIAAANLIDRAASIKPVLPYAAIAGLGIFGLVYTTLLITTDITSAQFEAAAFVANHIGDDAIIAASPTYSWIFTYVFDKESSLPDYRDLLFFNVETEKLVLVSDNNFQANMQTNKQLQHAYYNTTRIAVFEGSVREYDRYSYPYANMIVNYEGDIIEIRVGDSLQKTFNVQER
jgi:4-amino-4-deoxy-L-arabinose transferase-like glycosyltransferase